MSHPFDLSQFPDLPPEVAKALKDQGHWQGGAPQTGAQKTKGVVAPK